MLPCYTFLLSRSRGSNYLYLFVWREWRGGEGGGQGRTGYEDIRQKACGPVARSGWRVVILPVLPCVTPSSRVSSSTLEMVRR